MSSVATKAHHDPYADYRQCVSALEPLVQSRPAAAQPFRTRIAPSILDIVAVAAECFGVKAADLLGPSRERPLVTYRAVTYAACREITDNSYPAIARAFARREHSAVHAAVCRVRGDAKSAGLLRHLIEAVGRVA